jgi:hypothetical protein
MYRRQDVERNNLIIGNKYIENMAEFKYFGKTTKIKIVTMKKYRAD